MKSQSHSPHEILKQYWGFDQFRPLQEDIINSVIIGNDTLALLPTGGGKSICFQVPGLVLGGLTLVISPLIALMKDQVMQLNKRGIMAAALDSTLSQQQLIQVLDKAEADKSFRFLYLSPERLQTQLIKQRLKQFKIKLLAIDEAHCISQWGYDFRPEYLEIANFRADFPHVPIIALTATATPEVVTDIKAKLLFKPNHKLFQKSFVRSNLGYVVNYTENKLEKMLHIAAKMKGTGIIYAGTRKETESISNLLNKNGIKADFYHAGLESAVRSTKQIAWMQNKVRAMVCTNAFGMGIDKPDVRWVLHAYPPPNLESYFQEAGRAGRDEKLAWAVLLYHPSDDDKLEKAISYNFPPIEEVKRVYSAIGLYFQLAAGSFPDRQLPFDLADFVTKYKIQAGVVFNALKILHRAGYLLMQEVGQMQSFLMFLINFHELYKFQIANPQFDGILQLLPRLYGGLFEGLVPINEQLIAYKLQIKREEVEIILNRLNKLNIIAYQPIIEKPTLLFLRPYQTAENLHFPQLTYSWLKERAQKRLNAVLDFVKNKKRCRSIQLIAYFGEEIEIKCGKCDVCRGLYSNNLDLDLSMEQFNKLKPLLPLPLASVKAALKINDNLFGEFLRFLVDEDLIGIDETNNVYLK